MTAQDFMAGARGGRFDLALPGAGDTWARLAALAGLGRDDLVLARLGEGHADARAILAELGDPWPDDGPAGWGVWAAVPDSVSAIRRGGDWYLTGDRPWCSGAGFLTRALVTAGDRLFAVRVRAPSAVPVDGTWPAVGMAASDSRTVRFTDAPAAPVGPPGAYTGRPGFWHGAIGVAACWYGGATGVADTLLSAARNRPLNPHALAQLGAVDARLAAAGALLRHAAERIDAEPKADLRLLAQRVRAVVEDTATEVMDRVGRALGAAPLCLDAAHARRIADLTVYLRQSHAETDLAALGGALAGGGEPSW